MKLLSTIFLVIFAFSLEVKELSAQLNSDISMVLNTAFKENSVKFKNEKSYQLASLDFTVPLLEKVEMRTETNDFDLKKQDLTMRVSPNNGANRKAHRLYHESVKFMSEMELNTEIIKALYDKYNLIKNYVFAKEKLKVSRKKNVIALDKVKLLKKMVSLSSFDIVDLIEAEDEVNRLHRTIQNIENDLLNLEYQLVELLSKEEINIELEHLISVNKIKNIISLRTLVVTMSHPEEEVLSAKYYNTVMEHDWKESKNNFSIGFLQASYGHEPDKPFGSNFSLGIGFDFPIKGSTGLELNEIKINILDAQGEYLERVEEIKKIKQNSESRLLSLIGMYELLSQQIQEGNASHALIEYSKQSVASPQAILKLNELVVNNEALLIDIQSDIMDTYLRYLYSNGVIGIKPYKNYFDANLSILH